MQVRAFERYIPLNDIDVNVIISGEGFVVYSTTKETHRSLFIAFMVK